jgi:Ni,Fe-hydrogenase maturation factor
LAPELAARIAEVDVVIFVDARLAASPSETCEVRRIGANVGRNADGHACDPPTLLALAGHAYGRRPFALSVTIPALDLSFGERLSATTRREARAAINAIRTQLASGLGERPAPITPEGLPCTNSA